MIGELEDAVVARINLFKPTLEYTLPTVQSYGGQIDEEKQATFQFPAVFPAFIGMKEIRPLGERDRLVECEFVLYVATRNPRNERATRQGDLHNVGSYQLAEDMIALLEGQRLGMPMFQPIRFTKISTLFVARKSDGANAESILAVSFVCGFAWRAALPECAYTDGEPEFTQVQNDWLKTGQTFYIKPGDDDADLSAVTIHAEP